ncbi:MAG TPA: enoyl-CoA hydratase/isomerase family protein [Myxococcota bacterium]|nr:enoyl-CoA hydratase/isomerase family protein [Myxococcota bacterium]HRY92038.1 enoyl-CoA hydratase/isomerase family protein [Myxococcota bacterium]HSA23200.1 enoyl-CoA hydratase/isomerase family protein [Myxococcota bacterium]
MRLHYEMRGDLGVLRLHNPPHNALVSPVFAARAELAAFLAQPELRGVMVVGEGRHFCAGANVEALRAAVHGDPRELGASMREGQALLELIANAPVPVVALVRGSCLGAGLEIALACHFRLATPNALLGFPETDHGLLPGLGGVLASLGVMPRARALELVLSGRLVRGEEAAAFGLLVDRCVPAGRLEAEGEELLHGLVASRSASLVHEVVQAVQRATRLGHEEALRAEGEAFCRLASLAAERGGEEP